MSLPLTSAIFNHHVELDTSGGDVPIEPQNMVGIFAGGAGDVENPMPWVFCQVPCGPERHPPGFLVIPGEENQLVGAVA